MTPPNRPGQRLIGYRPATQGKGKPFRLVGEYERTKPVRGAAPASLTHDPDGLYAQADEVPRGVKRGLLL